MSKIKKMFNGLVPIVIDCEMSGVDPSKHALLEVAAYALEHNNELCLAEHYHQHVNPFPGALFDQQAMEINGIIADHPLRFAIDEHTMLEQLNEFIHKQLTIHGANRAILVGHNIHFDLAFLTAAQERTGIKLRIHHFCVLDTATLGMLFFSQSVLAKIIKKAGIQFDPNLAHGALYDAKKTAELFCYFFNRGLLENRKEKSD